ncbi:S8 family serine peptidase [Nonomuraea dietziae]|uniref:S8 family serine peptidase n=1 Tax=Nonomuraea dietziae TaxID=65515 RepID=UPI003434A810
MDFTSQVLGGHLFVIPSDARTLVTQGVLDRRLFDVTQLLAWGYGDADTPDIPVISQGMGVQAFTPQGARQTRQLSSLGMSALRVPKANAGQAWKDLTGEGAHTLAAGKAKLWVDGRRSFSLDQSVKQIGAPEAWAQGMTGKDVTVAVLDSGYDPDHPDLKDAVVQERNFSDDPDIRDMLGHGTHVASIVAGRGEKYRGVAPEAKLAIGKLGSDTFTDSALLAGMEWAAVEVKAKVVNMSLGAPDTWELDVAEQAVNTLSERTGTLFVVAAGNDGPVNSPGSAEAALTVGAVDKQNRMAEFSSPGPRITDHAIKPDVTAPGVDIVAAAASGTADGSHVAMSGTSMATPHVAGAAAILAQRHPEWTGAQLKAALIGSAARQPGAGPYQQGAGLVDLVRGLKQQVAATPANVWAAFPWNGTGERVATRTVTYANSGDAPVSLDLTAEGQVLKLSADRLEVPARGEASVALTIDAAGTAPGDYPGTVTARSGETVIRTLAGAYVEPESYDVIVTATGRQGQPADPTVSQVYDAKTGIVHPLAAQNGVAKIRLPEGDWNLYTEIAEKVDGKWITTIADQPVKVDGGDQQVTVDAREGRPARITLDDPTAQPQRRFDYGLAHGKWNYRVMTGGREVNNSLFVVPVRRPGLTYTLATKWLSKDVSPSPYVYDLVHRHADGIPEDPTYNARQKDLAKVTATYRASGVAATGRPLAGFRVSDWPAQSLGWLVGEIKLPGTLTHYRTPGLIWESGLEVGTSLVFDGGRLMQQGQTSEVWNTAVTGPTFLLPGGNRSGDKLTFSAVGSFADAGSGRTGSDSAAAGTATLARDGKVLAKADLPNCGIYEPQGCELRADLPAESALYTLTSSMRRQVPHSALSTGVQSVWTFPSSNTAKEQPLPLMAIRYAPGGLDDFNRAKPGTVTRLPLSVERNPGSPQAEVKSLRLEMSADDGTTWHRIPVVRTGSGWTAAVPNPRTPGFVSLRAAATDTAGAALTQTITRAYAVG